jgi:glycosyltransferase involved in cell wall biosynthesis
LVVTRRVDFRLKRSFPTRWKYGRADAVACISNRILELVREAGVPAEKTIVIPSGIDPSSYPSRADRDRLRRERNVPRTDLVLVHVGALVPHKDQATLLRAVQRVAREEANLRLFIVGDGPLRGPLERLARELGVAGRTTFLGREPDPLSWTALADLFVFSSKEEGLGTALIDALALGVPTAATSAGGIPDIYGGPGAPELSPPGNPENLARNILSVLRDPAEASRRAARGRARAALFTVDAMTGSYEKLYGGLLASSLQPPASTL